MANTVKIKHSDVSSAVPATLEQGELAINTADALLFWEDNVGAINSTHLSPAPSDIGAATAAQGSLADSAVQPGDLATVATSGSYSDLGGIPSEFTPTSHASSHATSGSDALAPSDIGAAPAASPTFTGVITVSTGTASAPSIVASGDSTTGLSFATNTLIVSTAGTERVRFEQTKATFTDFYQDIVSSGTTMRLQVSGNVAYVQALSSTALRLRVDGQDDFQIYASSHLCNARIGIRAGSSGVLSNLYTTYDAAVGDAAIGLSGQVLTISTAGTERLRVQGDGKVSIGDPASQSSASLLIRKGQDSSSVIRLDGAAPTAAGSYYGVLSAPTVSGASNSTYVHFTASESGTGDFAVSYGFLAGDSLSGTSGARGIVSSLSDGPGRWNVYASGTAKNYFAGQVQFGSGSALAPAIANAGDSDTGMFFGTNIVAISTAGTERMRVDSSGRVGIGASPSHALDVASTSEVSTRIRRATAGGQANLRIEDGDGSYYDLATVGNVLAFINNASERMRIDASGRLGIGTASPTAALDINFDKIRLRTAKTPASASDTGNAGDICWDSSYIYVCVATNTWRRIAHSTW